MLEQYYYFIFAYFLVGLIVALCSFISLNSSLRLLANRKLRNDKVFIRANVVLHRESLLYSIVWPYLLGKMGLESWKLLNQYYPKAGPAKGKEDIVAKSVHVEEVLPPRVKPKQMTRRNRRE